MTTFYYDRAMNMGISSDSELGITTPTTGVIDGTSPLLSEWVNEEIWSSHDLGYEEHLRECEDHKKGRDCYCEPGGEVLMGDWRRTWEWRTRFGKVTKPFAPNAKRHKVWAPVEHGKHEYAAIYNKDSYTIQVLWSKWVQHDARWCSPCYPNQASIGTTDGGVQCYLLPPELHRCFVCHDYNREVVYCPEIGSMLCDACCERYAIDYKTGMRRTKEVNNETTA